MNKKEIKINKKFNNQATKFYENYVNEKLENEDLEYQKIEDEIEDKIEAWIYKNINVIVVDFDLRQIDYMKSLLNEEINDFRTEIENTYLNERISKLLKNRQDEEDRAKLKREKKLNIKPKA
jgi:hypothetical protein